MWIRLFFLFLFFQFDLISQDSTSIILFQKEYQQIKEIKNESKREKAQSNFFTKQVENGVLFTKEVINILLEDNSESYLLAECGRNVDKLISENNVSGAQDFLYSLHQTNIAKSKLEQLILQRIQSNPDQTDYVEMLIYGYLLENKLNQAWIQRRALDMRLKSEQGKRLENFAFYLYQVQQYALASQAYDYLKKVYVNAPQKNRWAQLSLSAREQVVLNSIHPALNEVRNLIQDYKRIRQVNNDMLRTYLSEGKLYAYQLNRLDSAALILEEGIKYSNADISFQAELKLEYGNILMFQGKKYDALIQWAQVEKQMKDSPLAYEAKLKSAKLYYFTGDFELSKDLLNILKQGSQREIANDALNLSMVIDDNSGIDTLELALKNFSTIQFLYEQQKFDEGDLALARFDTKNQQASLEDDVLFLRAQRKERLGELKNAEELYQTIYEKFPQDIYGDDALYRYLYLTKFENKELCMNFIRSYPSSWYLSEIRSQLIDQKALNFNPKK